MNACRCSSVLGPMGETLRFTKRDQDVMIHTVVEPMASEGLRTISIAYRDFTTSMSSSYISHFIHSLCHISLVREYVFTAQCTLVQSAVLRSHVVCLSVRLSVCPSVTLVICDHIGWKSWKLTAQSISPTPSLIAAKRRSTYSHGNMGKFWGD